MKHLLNTLFVTTQGAYLAREGETVLVRVEQETRLRVPVHTLGGIVCFGNVGASPFLLGLCGERGVAVAFLTERGRFLARVEGPVRGNVLLRREQYRRADDAERCAGIVRAIVVAKVANARTVLQRAVRDHADTPGVPALEAAAEGLAGNLRRLEGPHGEAMNVDTLRGVEGEAAATYFGAFDHLIVSQKEGFRFVTRTRRPPLDPVNALLSFLYTLLTHDVVAALESVGLDPAVGFLHRDRSGRPGLALDLMEEFRPALADRLALSLINRQQVRAKGFTTTDTGAVTMDDATRKEVLVAWQTRKQEEILHPYLGEKVAVGLLPYTQALLLARHLRGDIDAYPAFFWK
jgi:CRISPR-associated protein Cas1